IAGANIAPTQGGGSSTIAPATRNTNGSGVATFTLTDSTPQTVTYGVAGVTQTASVAFTSGALDHLVLSPANATITAGASQAYTAEGFDSSNHDLGDVTRSTVFTASPDRSCTGAGCGATAAGAHPVPGATSGQTGP